ncbi:serine/threonine-protein kinase STE20-like isoform X2 [Acanthaster planci]|uniref:Serine/threonine-protein kinase STE20-like isoform X2 n=1 Tax=Acanthaster planci TaxID=133434 RepID=A0A8B7XSE1_ACAPL|nr:serine/threonine-protein kinase STE20-like isoform X2 [Acanthaster planci]
MTTRYKEPSQPADTGTDSNGASCLVTASSEKQFRELLKRVLLVMDGALSDLLPACRLWDHNLEVFSAKDNESGSHGSGKEFSSANKGSRGQDCQTPRSGQTSPPTQVPKSSGGGGDDGDGSRRPPSGADKKKLDCDRPSENKTKKKTAEEGESDSAEAELGSGDEAAGQPTENGMQAPNMVGAALEEEFEPSPELDQGRNFQGARNPPFQSFLEDQNPPLPLESWLPEGGVVRPDRSAAVGVMQGDCGQLNEAARRIDHERDLDPAILAEVQDGVLMDEGLIAENGHYIENDQFLKLEQIGKGAFSKVFLIEDNQSKKHYAVKCVPLERFFLYEVLLWSDLEHNNIGHLRGVVRTGSEVLLISKYIPGQTLEQMVTHRVLSQGEALKMVRPLSCGVCYLHAKDVVHNDIKLDNIIGEPCRNSLVNPVLVDFGCAMRRVHVDMEGVNQLTPDVDGVMHALISILQGPKRTPRARIPPSTDERLKQFIKGVLEDPERSAAKTLENWPHHLEEELDSVPAVMDDEGLDEASIGVQTLPDENPRPCEPPRAEWDICGFFD